MGIGDVRSSNTTRKKGSSYQRQRIVQSAMGITITTVHLREFASMTEDLQLEITVTTVINGSQFIPDLGFGRGHLTFLHKVRIFSIDHSYL
jgi:hypothetical protein